MVTQSVLYEQPINELIRVCLRLEYLLQQAQHGLRGSSVYDTRLTMSALTNILNLTDRPDLRNKLTKEFMRQHANLQRYLNTPKIDQKKLLSTLGELDQIISMLQSNNGKFAGELRDNEFLTTIRQHLTSPGSTCSFDTPAYYYWLQLPNKDRQNTLINWINALENLYQAVHFLLHVIRQSGRPQLITAPHGFYHTSLDSQISCQLIQVVIPNTVIAFPEISAGRHGLSIRFYHPTLNGRATPFEEDVTFQLIFCIL